MASEYVINVKAIIDASGTTTTPTPNQNDEQNPQNGLPTKLGTKTANSLSYLAGVRHVAQNITKIGGTFGDENFKKASQNVSKLVQYSAKGVKALTGDPVAILDLAVDVICDIGQKVKEIQVKEATRLNQEDVARIKAGLYNVEDTICTTDSFSGRYDFKNRK